MIVTVKTMPHPFWNCFFPFGKTGSLQVIIYQGEKDDQEPQQNRMEQGGAININHLPEELVIESILTRLPARTLAVCCIVSKLWYNSILNNPRFAVVHHARNKTKVSLVLNLLNVWRTGRRNGMYFFSLSGRREKDVDIRILVDSSIPNIYETVGFCNGIACLKMTNAPDYTRGLIAIVNPNRGQSLALSYSRPTGGYLFVCHGFGYDPLSQVYKAVMVFASEANDEFLCMVITLGTMSWRKASFGISPPPGSSPFPSGMVTRVARMVYRQATICGGGLFWMTKNLVTDSNAIDMLLSFDLHDEKIHFIRLPTECTLTTPTGEGDQYLAADHLLEFKGYPCVARSERLTTRSNHGHRGHRCNYRAGVCCCCYKIHMYLLKDKDKQEWTREETFHVQVPTPLCCLMNKKPPFYRWFGTSAATPTRMLIFSDQVLLYWFNGERLILYNVQEKHLKVVECFRSYPSVFQSKMNRDLERYIGGGDENIYCPTMDYQLHAQVENMVSLENFIPKEAKISEGDHADKVMNLLEDDNPATGWLTSRRKPHTFYAFS